MNNQFVYLLFQSLISEDLQMYLDDFNETIYIFQASIVFIGTKVFSEVLVNNCDGIRFVFFGTEPIPSLQ
jgi:hypothetical protein